MRNIVLSSGLRRSTAVLNKYPLLYPGICTTRSASLSNAIGRGIRRSQGVGFRGKEKDQARSPRDGTGNAPIRRSSDVPPGVFPKNPMTRTAWKKPTEPAEDRPPRGRFGEILKTPPTYSKAPASIKFGKRVLDGDVEKPRGRQGGFGDNNGSFDRRTLTRRDESADRSSPRAGKFDARTRKRSFEQKDEIFRHSEAQHQQRETQKYRNAPDHREIVSAGRNQKWEHRGKSGSYESGSSVGRNQKWENRGKSDSYESEPSASFLNSKATYPSLEARKSSFGLRTAERPASGTFFKENSRGRSTGFNDRDAPPRSDEGNASSSRPAQFTDKRMPLSIPYTTPASEFLYGTSVVEAALKSKRQHRRKLYKLYIHTGENRESGGRDAELERLARRLGIKVARVGTEWLPLLDKMSASRPHNGYILEASPLPRLPVISLGALTEQDGNVGFEVTVNRQTREDAAINGTSNFVRSSKNTSERNPLVLFLDSIVDAGNLGGIIRTASFLGASAVAISKNCTSISPIVLKASAGASENITLFTVDKPAGFIADSKLAGWKIFAAVAPAAHSTPRTHSQKFTDDLTNPLSDDPCILMLGSEGEGLRTNLVNKADVQLSIRGSGENKGVDSLNVSVAAGILCNAFLRRSNRKTASPSRQEPEEEEEELAEPGGDLF